MRRDEPAMAERTTKLEEMLEAALGALDEAIAVLDGESRVVFWNPAATEITGYRSADLLSRVFPSDLYSVDAHHHALSDVSRTGDAQAGSPGRPVLVNLRHSQGHSLPGMLRRTPLKDDMGRRFGTLLRFHPVEEIDTLPHGINVEGSGHENRVEESQADVEDRLDDAWREWIANAVPFGLLWVAVDQAAMLRKTHGGDASEAMLAIVERTLLHGLRPSEILGRWGTNEFLVLCHERTPELLQAHAQHLAGLARTADFRWWGDRVSLTVSIGAAQAAERTSSIDTESLRGLLKRAQQGMQESSYAGGNHMTFKEKQSTGGMECSQS